MSHVSESEFVPPAWTKKGHEGKTKQAVIESDKEIPSRTFMRLYLVETME
jgi:hypothetical protein